jgi:hypothetical protein
MLAGIPLHGGACIVARLFLIFLSEYFPRFEVGILAMISAWGVSRYFNTSGSIVLAQTRTSSDSSSRYPCIPP